MSRIPQVAVRRLPIYLRVLEELAEQEIEIASSAELARRSGFSSEQIRKDLAYFGAFGRRGVGYGTRTLSRQLRGILGLDPDVRAVLIGAGNLGTALARYNLVRHRDVRILHIFDNDQLKVGTMIESVRVRHVAEAESVVQAEDIRLAILAVPALAAQRVADQLIGAGIQALLNFSPIKLEVPRHVYVQQIDLSLELQSLAFYISRPPRGPARGEEARCRS